MPRAPSDTVDLKVRMREPLRAALERAAKEYGSSMNAEAVRRLEASFEKSNMLGEVMSLAYGRELAGILMTIGMALREVGPASALVRGKPLEARGQWLNDAHGFDQAALAVSLILAALRPKGEGTAPEGALTVFGEEKEVWGELFARGALDAVAGGGSADQLKREGAQIADLLGSEVAKRAKGRRSAR